MKRHVNQLALLVPENNFLLPMDKSGAVEAAEDGDQGAGDEEGADDGGQPGPDDNVRVRWQNDSGIPGIQDIRT